MAIRGCQGAENQPLAIRADGREGFSAEVLERLLFTAVAPIPGGLQARRRVTLEVVAAQRHRAGIRARILARWSRHRGTYTAGVSCRPCSPHLSGWPPGSAFRQRSGNPAEVPPEPRGTYWGRLKPAPQAHKRPPPHPRTEASHGTHSAFGRLGSPIFQLLFNGSTQLMKFRYDFDSAWLSDTVHESAKPTIGPVEIHIRQVRCV